MIQKENLILIVNKNCDFARNFVPGTPIEITDAKNEIFVCSKHGHSARKILDALFIAHEIKPNIGLETASIEIGKRIVSTSKVVMACPDAYVDMSNSETSPYYAYPILGVETPRHFYACYRKDLYLTKYIRGLLEILHEYAQGG